MANIRIYEAARKLNIETKELMDILKKGGLDVKSPISFIPMEKFEEILAGLTSAPDPGKEEKVVDISKAADAKKKAAEPSKKSVKKKSKLKLAPPVEDKAIKEKPSKPKSVKKKQAAQKSAAKKSEAAEKPLKAVPEPKPESKPEKAKSAKPEPKPETKPETPVMPAATQQPGSGSTVVSYLALGMAAMALAAMLVLNSTVTNNTASVTRMMESTQALQAEIAAVNDGLKINQDLIFENRETLGEVGQRLDGVHRVQIKESLTQQSAALEELAPSLRADIGGRVSQVSKDLGSLASSL